MRVAAMLAGILAMTGTLACGRHRPLAVAHSPAATAPAAASAAPTTSPASAAAAKPEAPDAFERDVKPLLMRKCAPCHAPGGSLYARLPFDDPEVVRPRAQKIRGRLKPDEWTLLERWLNLPPEPPSPPPLLRRR